MKNIDEMFLAALKAELDAARRGTRARLAEKINVAPSQITDIVKGRRPTQEEQRREIASYFNFSYDDFLERGRAIIEGRPIPEPSCDYLSDAELSDRGFITVPFSADMKLSTGGGGTIPYTDDEESSSVVIHGPTLKRRNSRGLQAFLVGGESMEPVIASGATVIVDTTQTDLRQIRDEALYVICWDFYDGECAVKYLRWAEKGRLLSIESANPSYKPVFRSVDDVILIGRVIWSCREHKY